MTGKRFLKGYHTIRDKKENKIYDFRIENVLFLLNELDEKYVDEYALRETLQVDLQRVEKENEQLKKERNHFERKKTEYLTELNKCRIKNTELRKDNLQTFALLGDIRALARTSDIETIIKEINKFEKEVVK